jgi:YlmC/YmxH family sporulation protein
MDLSYRDLKKRDVINVADGRCLGKIIDVVLSFPRGILTGIVVPGRRVYGFRLFDRTEIFIQESNIIKIGGDVILVNVNCGDVCSPSIQAGKKPPPPNNHCPPPCPPPCDNNCPPKNNGQNSCGGKTFPDCQEFLDVCRIDQSDY